MVADAGAGMVARMFRARTLRRLRAGLVLALTATLSVACTSDDLAQTTTTTSGTTMIDPTEVHQFTTADSDETYGTTFMPPGDMTCRQAIFCVTQCALNLPNPTPPEYDLSCFEDCLKDLTTAEWLKLIRLSECIGNHCYETGVCTPENTGDEPCNNCLLLGISATNPPVEGCEAEAAACK